MAKDDVFSYVEYVHGYAPAPHHREMVDHLLKLVRDHDKGGAIEPRGAAKTTWGNTGFLSYVIARNPDLRVCLASNTAKQALDFSRAIHTTISSNPRHIELFGFQRGDKWTDAEWIHAQSRWRTSKDVSMYAVGVGGAIISKRFDLIVCDDILDEENTQTLEQREKVETWFLKTLLPCLVPGGAVLILGTRWADEDLYAKLMAPVTDGGLGWKFLVRSALLEDRETGELSSYWPEEWPVATLLKRQEELGADLFNCAYQNDVTGLMRGNVFRNEYFRYFDILEPDSIFTVRMGVDLASSEKERADYTARATTAEDQEGNYFVLSVVRDKRESHHAEFVADGWMAHPHMGAVIIENQQFQSTLIQEIMRDYPRIPVQGKRADVDKVTRARAVAAKIEAHKVFFHRSLVDSEFVHELLSFPRGHDDMVDALGYSMDLGGDMFFYGSVKRR